MNTTVLSSPDPLARDSLEESLGYLHTKQLLPASAFESCLGRDLGIISEGSRRRKCSFFDTDSGSGATSWGSLKLSLVLLHDPKQEIQTS